MRFLAISGSARAQSTNAAMLRSIARLAPAGIEVDVFDGIGALPVFSPDLEGADTPAPVCAFMQAIGRSDGLIIASPDMCARFPVA